MSTTFASRHGMRYPELGDPKPKPGTEVLLIKKDGKHVRGVWSDEDCKAWGALPAGTKSKKASKACTADE